MKEKTLKQGMDEVYSIGLKNGSIEMKNKIMKSLNRDWKLFRTTEEIRMLIKVLKKINKIKI